MQVQTGTLYIHTVLFHIIIEILCFAVCGLIPSGKLGYTLTHEHFHLDFHHFYAAPPQHLEEILGKNEIKLEGSGIVRQFPYSSQYNLDFCDTDTKEAVAKDLLYYKKWGGVSIVENSSLGLNRDLGFLKQVSEETGVHCIAGTGHYVAMVQDPGTLSLTIEQMTDMYTKDLIEGENGVKCGFIGEVGSGWPISGNKIYSFDKLLNIFGSFILDFEKRAIEATALVREQVDCGVSFHPGRDAGAPFEIVRLYLEAGGKANRCVMSHIDRTILNTDDILEFAKLGTFVQLDLFGTECSFYQLNPDIDMVSDADRINKCRALIAEGFEDQLLMSHDIHTKHRLVIAVIFLIVLRVRYEYYMPFHYRLRSVDTVSVTF